MPSDSTRLEDVEKMPRVRTSVGSVADDTQQSAPCWTVFGDLVLELQYPKNRSIHSLFPHKAGLFSVVSIHCILDFAVKTIM